MMGAQPIPILMYHSVGATESEAYRRLTVSPDTFALHMAALVEQGYHPMTIRNLVAARQSGTVPARAVAVTFDDGLRDFLTGALPILQRYAVPATLFIATRYVGATARWLTEVGEGNRPMLSWNEVREIAAVGIECGAHTHSHPQLDIIGNALAGEEIRTGKKVLEDQLDADVVSFAYPYGYSSRKTRQLVRAAGFASACRVRHALSSADEDLFALSRIIVTDTVTAEDLLDLMAGEGLAVAPPADRLIGTGWRLARRAMLVTQGAPWEA